MGFGFSPSDIVLFIDFARRVAKSLSDESGAKAEYQDAELQCNGFVDVMNEIQALDLTSLSKTSRDRIENNSADAQRFVGEFKERISKYERAMGKSTKRGWVGSVPRRVQWAFDAADDLGKFRQSLVPLIQLVHIEISVNTFALVTNHVKALPMPPVPMARSSSPTTRAIGAPPMQNYLELRRDDTGYHRSLALEIADLIYDRLKSGSGTSIADYGKVYTLPSSTDVEPRAEQRASQTDMSLQKVGNPTVISSSMPLKQRNSRELILNGDANAIQRGVNIDKFSGKSLVPYTIHASQAYERRYHRRLGARNDNEDENSFVDSINEYLRSLNMSELSESEKGLLPGYAESSQILLPSKGSDGEKLGSSNDFEPPTQRLPLRNMPDANAAESLQDSKFLGNHTGKPKRGWRSRMPSFGIDPLSVAASAAGVVSYAVQLSLTLRWYSRDHHNTPREFQSLHEDILRYSGLLQLVTDILANLSTNEKLEWFAVSILRESEEILCLIRRIIHAAIRYKAPFRSLIVLLKWRSARQKTMEAYANVKSLMSIALQAHQAQAMQSLQYDTNRNSHLMLGNLQAILAYNEHAARPEESMGHDRDVLGAHR